MPDRDATGSRAVGGAAAALEKDVGWLARAVAETAIALTRAEAKIEADARQRIQALRDDSKGDLAVLYGSLRTAKRVTACLVTGSATSSSQIEEARRAVAEARAIADAMIERFHRAMCD